MKKFMLFFVPCLFVLLADAQTFPIKMNFDGSPSLTSAGWTTISGGTALPFAFTIAEPSRPMVYISNNGADTLFQKLALWGNYDGTATGAMNGNSGDIACYDLGSAITADSIYLAFLVQAPKIRN